MYATEGLKRPQFMASGRTRERRRNLQALLYGLVLVAALGLDVQTIHAGSGPSPHAVGHRLLAQRSLTAAEAAALVRSRTGGRVLAVDEVREQGRTFYRVKVLTREGDVRILMVDAVTGAM